MRVRHLISPGPIAGAEKSVLASLSALAKEQVEVQVAVIRELRQPHLAEEFCRLVQAVGVPYQMLDCNRQLDVGLIRHLRRSLHDEPSDILHAHGYKSLFYALSAKPKSTALVATYHGATSHTLRARMYEWLEQTLYRRVQRLFVVSQTAYDQLIKQGVSESKTVFVPNMLSFDLLDLEDCKKTIADDALRLLFLGRLSHEKGLDVLLEALSRLKKDLLWQLKVVGDGPKRMALQQQSKALGIDPNVLFVGFQNDVLTHLRQSDALVMPSRTEGMPMSLIEATACAKPVIASRVGAVADLVNHDQNGLLVSPGQPEQLARAIVLVSRELKRFQAAAQSQAHLIQQKYSPRRWAKRALREYQQALLCV